MQWIYYLALLAFLPQSMMAEGSKELNAHGGARAFLLSSNLVTTSFPFPTLGTMKVYVKAGETINIGSSAQGFSSGTINLRAPDGTTYTSGSSTTVGLIKNHAQEVAGPLPNAGGYTPYKQTVTTDQEGVWEIDFIAPGSDNSIESAPTAILANADWSQPSGPYIAAFDITVRNAANANVSGRVFTNIFSGILSTFNLGFNGIFHILTQDGYQYTLDNNGQAGNGFSFFVNNKGFKTSGGAASYKSINNVAAPLIKDPTTPDTQLDITHKIFFNPPAADLPATAKTPGGGITWLVNPLFVPTVGPVKFTGTEGTDGQAGTSPLGGTFSFNATANGSYILSIDANKNGSFTDAVDRKITGIAVIGVNTITWDGLDGTGHKLGASTSTYNANLSLSLYSAEVHFPFFDVERNVNGILLTRTTGNGAPDNTVYWDDSDIAINPGNTPSSPIKNLTGLSSLVNGHKWGKTTVANSDSDFGNDKSMDTWAYVSSAPINTLITFLVREADLEVLSLTSDITAGCIGQTIHYTVVVKNNGPSDVTGSAFAFNFPTQLTGIQVTNTATTGTPVLSQHATTATAYQATLDMANGSAMTFTISGKVSSAPAGKLTVTASIMRPADITDPDATNPDSVTPTDPFSECDSPPSGAGCNNIKIDSTTFIPAPDAGPDQSVEKNKIATLTANQPGTWAQIGNTAAVATIESPASAKTNVSGLTQDGLYNFLFTNANGCTDSVTVNVSSSTLDAANVVTPNGDGKDDTFVIPDIGLFPGSHLAIYNRWGNEVFHSDNYANNWAGQGLADGTYFYLLNRKNANGSIKVFKGWIYLKR